MTVLLGNIDPFWNNSFKNLEFEKQPVSPQEIAKWQQQGYSHDSFTGSLYSSKNIMPEWVYDVSQLLGLEKCGYAFYKMSTYDIMPTHVDHFNRYCEVFDVAKDSVWRAVVFLEDWKSGHYFEIDSKCISNYKAGHYVIWSSEEPHFAANIGLEDRYTLQITGTFPSVV